MPSVCLFDVCSHISDNQSPELKHRSTRAAFVKALQDGDDVRVHIPTEETELRDLLDRILDKSLFLGAANLLLLSETNLAAAHSRVQLVSMHMHIGYHPVRQTLSHYSRRRRKSL